MDLACNSLERGFGSQPQSGAESRLWEHKVLATRPAVSDKGPDPSALQKRISTKTESNKASRVFIKRKKSTVEIHTGGLGRERVTESCPHGSLNYFYGTFLPGSLWSILSNCLVHSPCLVYLRILQRVRTHASLSRDGFYRKGLWVAWCQLASLPFDLQGAFLCMWGRGGLLSSGMRSLWSAQGPAPFLNRPASLILEFCFTANESPIILPWWAPSTACLTMTAAAAKSLQSCPTLCNPIDGSPPGSPVPGILQARTLEWVAISFSNAWKWKWSRSVVSDS